MSKFVAKTHLVRSPTLLIGIGGIGGQIASKVNKSLSDRDKSRIKIVVMDTNTNDLEKFENSNIPYIQTSKNQSVQSYLDSTPDYLKWFPTDPFINNKSLIAGAGQIRAVSRLGALASKGNGDFGKIKKAIDEILENQGDTLVRAVRVMIVGSATGGTGSGLGIQLPFFVRNTLEQANIPNALIRGLFLMPNITEEKQSTPSTKSAVNVNGYAFLKELNAFYRSQTVKSTDTLLRIEEYVPGMRGKNDKTQMSAMIPYDFLYLVEKHSNDGNIGGLEEYIERSAQIVTNQLFSPVSASGLSAEDNLITQIVASRGMSRYCGAGVANAIYPKDEVIKYCTSRYATELLDEIWLKIDTVFRKRDEQQRRLRKTDPSLKPLDKAKTYCQIFDEMCDPSKQDISSDVASLRNELTIISRNADNEEVRINLVEHMASSIKRHLMDSFAEAHLDVFAESCKLAVQKNSPYIEVIEAVGKKMERVKTFKEISSEKTDDLIIATAERILPSDLATAKDNSRDANYNIYIALSKKHPIIVRYVLYSLLNIFKEQKRIADSKMAGEISQLIIFEKDYLVENKKNEPIENPKEAITKVKKGLLEWANIYSSKYQSVLKTIVEDLEIDAKNTLEFAENRMYSKVYRTVIERLEELIELYENFFEELGVILEDKKKESERLESGKGEGVNDTFKGDRYICSDSQCKRVLYHEFTQNVSESELEMTDEMKNGFFDKMFAQYTVNHARKANKEISHAPVSYRTLFIEGILNPITAQFSKKGFKHIDMGILDAIYKQYQIKNPDTAGKKDSAEFAEYFRSICASLRSLSAPYLVYSASKPGYTNFGQLAHSWGINYSAVADYQIGEPGEKIDDSKLKSLFKTDSDQIIPDDSFSPYELVCYTCIYDLRIENCVTYQKGGHTESCYAERLDNYAKRDSFVRGIGRDSELDVIHPHLDKHWHEHAYLPELMEYDDKEMCNNIRMAFLLSWALKRCTYVSNTVDCIENWCYQSFNVETNCDESTKSVYVDGKELKSQSILALYKAFDRNRVMVKNVLDYADVQKDKAYNSSSFSGNDYDSIVAQTIIEGFIHTPSAGKEKDGKPIPKAIDGDTFSILDVLYYLYLDSADRAETKLLIGSLDKYLYEYCLCMLNENENKAKEVHKKVKKPFQYPVTFFCLSLHHTCHLNVF